ncbi:nucleotide sugar dehydrogenase [Algihabitans albus]|uniref:nucleotide sugar dehydrogenase n=1 Tax=Algihabitans albus TaxID=2164067 RepID=UPI000E5DA36D|nr:nucleotide sugar dehydrogenase [Algihabitans albus]
MNEKIAVIGLGYVGLPVALAFAGRMPGTVGFDIDPQRIADLRAGRDATGEVDAQNLRDTALQVSDRPEDLAGVTFFVVTVPTPVTDNKQPDLRPLESACRTIAPYLTPGCIVVFESTVYPGVTEEVCGPLLAEVSGLTLGRDFTLGYSPERINPGDRVHTFEAIVKVVSGQDEATLERVAKAYETVVAAGVYRAASIKVAEAAKVIENTQRDINIALMNELSIIFDRLGIRAADVLAAARTKWNFLPFSPGLVGGHCIGVDPYYLTAKAQAVGYNPEVILSGRRINDQMGRFIAERTIKQIAAAGMEIRGARVGVLGLTFKEDVPDLRNSRVPDIIEELTAYGAIPLAHDPLADPEQARHEYGCDLVGFEALNDLSGIVVAVAHRQFKSAPQADLLAGLRPGGAVVDVKSMLDPAALPAGAHYWSL